MAHQCEEWQIRDDGKDGRRYCGACGKAQPEKGRLDPVPVEVVENETYEYGRLWPDGTFQSFGGWNTVKTAQKTFDDKSYEVRNVPEPLRPVLGRQLTKTRKEIFKAEAVPAGELP